MQTFQFFFLMSTLATNDVVPHSDSFGHFETLVSSSGSVWDRKYKNNCHMLCPTHTDPEKGICFAKCPKESKSGRTLLVARLECRWNNWNVSISPFRENQNLLFYIKLLEHICRWRLQMCRFSFKHSIEWTNKGGGGVEGIKNNNFKD